MPLITRSTYAAPPLLVGGHLQTIYPTLFRRFPSFGYRRERIATPDDDFLDLDWAPVGARRLAILSHGLEGDSRRSYILGMARALNRAGWDVLAWNCRGCSGEPNRQLRFYHSGATEDLDVVVRHALAGGAYDEIALIGFSLGGNMTLKYVGERGAALDARVRCAVAFSVPCDLRSSAMQLASRANAIYMRRFLGSLREKIRAKGALMPGRLDERPLVGMKTFQEFDDLYTAPLHGFRDAEEYWRRCSSRQFLRDVQIPTLLVNARNDPFLAAPCFPIEEARDHPLFTLEIPDAGGHVGFTAFNARDEYWSESRAIGFIAEHTG